MIQDWKTLYEVKGPKSLMEMTAVELEDTLKETQTVILSFGAPVVSETASVTFSHRAFFCSSVRPSNILTVTYGI